MQGGLEELSLGDLSPMAAAVAASAGDMGNVSKFLNRILGLKVMPQNLVRKHNRRKKILKHNFAESATN